MKILLGVAVSFAVMVMVVIAIGMLLPKQHVASRKAEFAAKPEELFALIAGDQRWRPDVVAYDAAPDNEGRRLVHESTRRGKIAYELLDANPPVAIKRRIATRGLPYSGTWAFSLQPHSATTVVQITENGEVYNPIFRFVSRFVIGPTSSIDTYLRALGKATAQPNIEINN